MLYTVIIVKTSYTKSHITKHTCRLAATAPRVRSARDWQTAYQSLVSAATSIAAYQNAQRHISPVIVTALTLQGIQCIS